MGWQPSGDSIKPIIVKDYNGHYRMDQVDLDDCRRLDELRAENGRLREQLRELQRAYDNCHEANCKIGDELNETRWKLFEAQKRLDKLEHIDVDWEVAKDDG